MRLLGIPINRGKMGSNYVIEQRNMLSEQNRTQTAALRDTAVQLKITRRLIIEENLLLKAGQIRYKPVQGRSTNSKIIFKDIRKNLMVNCVEIE